MLFSIFHFQSDSQDAEKQHSDVENNSSQGENTVRDYISSPGYDTSSSNAPTSSPDPCEYTYEGAIQDYKSRVMRASVSSFTSSTTHANDLKPDGIKLPKPKTPAADIEYRLNAFESQISQSERIETVDKKTLPKVDINKRREMFEKDSNGVKSFESSGSKAIGELTTAISIKDRLSSLQNREDISVKDAAVKKLNRLSGEFSRVKDRLSNIESPIVNSVAVDDKLTKIDVPVVPLKDRLITLHSAAFHEKPRDPAGAKKIDLLTDQKPNGEKGEELNGNGNEDRYRNGSPLIQFNVEHTGSRYNFAEPENTGSYSNGQLADLLDGQVGNINGDAGLLLEAIQEEREEQQLTSIPLKKPEVMPRTTRNITPDSQKIEFGGDARNSDASQSELITDFNDDDDDEDVSVSSSVKNQSICQHTHITINSSLDNTAKVERSDMVVVADEAVTETILIQNSNASFSVNVLTPELTVTHDSIIDSNHNYEVDNIRAGDELINEQIRQINDDKTSSCSAKLNSVARTITSSDVLDSSYRMEFTSNSLSNNIDWRGSILGTKKFESESSLSKNQRIKCQIVGVLEKTRKPPLEVPVVEKNTVENLSLVKALSPPRSPKSPKSPKSPSKSKNIFDFIKRNLLNEANLDAPDGDNSSQTSKPLSNSTIPPPEQISKENASMKSVDFQSADIDQLLDEELNKLSEDELQ